jgi:hypothetical protein
MMQINRLLAVATFEAIKIIVGGIHHVEAAREAGIGVEDVISGSDLRQRQAYTRRM